MRGERTTMGGSSWGGGGSSSSFGHHDGRGTSQPMGGSSYSGGGYDSYPTTFHGTGRGHRMSMGGATHTSSSRRYGGRDYSSERGGNINLFGLFPRGEYPARRPGGRPPRRGRPVDRSFRSVSLNALAALTFFGAVVRSVAIVATGVLMFAAVLFVVDEESRPFRLR